MAKRISATQMKEVLEATPPKHRLKKLDELLSSIPERKACAIAFRVTEKEYRRLEAACEVTGLTLPELFVQAVSCYCVPEFWAWIEKGKLPADFPGCTVAQEATGTANPVISQ